MTRILLPAALIGTALPAHAASGPFFSLGNTDFIVTIAFLLFVGVLVYFRVPQLLGSMLDKRAEGIRSDLEEARKLREEAQELYASFERRSREVKDQAAEIVDNAKRESQIQATKAQEDLKASIARRLKAAEDQIASAESDAVRAVRDQAVSTAMAATTGLLAQQKSEGQRRSDLDAAIDEVAKRLN